MAKQNDSKSSKILNAMEPTFTDYRSRWLSSAQCFTNDLNLHKNPVRRACHLQLYSSGNSRLREGKELTQDCTAHSWSSVKVIVGWSGSKGHVFTSLMLPWTNPVTDLPCWLVSCSGRFPLGSLGWVTKQGVEWASSLAPGYWVCPWAGCPLARWPTPSRLEPMGS